MGTYELTRDKGSSPHARGAPSSLSHLRSSFWDHPRMRGEHQQGVLAQGNRLGIIPACAGSTKRRCQCHKRMMGSSPHARGAPARSYLETKRTGDHPRMRGEHGTSLVSALFSSRIIPACAGST